MRDDLLDYVDAVVQAIEPDQLLDSNRALDPLLSSLEIKDGTSPIHEHVYCAEGWVHVVEPSWLANRATHYSDDAAGSPDELIRLLRGVLEGALAGEYDTWGYEYPVYAEIPIQARTGHRAILACHYAAAGRTIEHPIEWIGAFQSPRAFRSWLRLHGYWTHIDQFDVLPREAKLAFWQGMLPLPPDESLKRDE